MCHPVWPEQLWERVEFQLPTCLFSWFYRAAAAACVYYFVKKGLICCRRLLLLLFLKRWGDRGHGEESFQKRRRIWSDVKNFSTENKMIAKEMKRTHRKKLKMPTRNVVSSPLNYQSQFRDVQAAMDADSYSVWFKSSELCFSLVDKVIEFKQCWRERIIAVGGSNPTAF